jgi:hypothetical protein
MNEFEKYILEHRDELDRIEAVPEEAIWRKLKAKATPPPPTKPGFNWRLLAIAALLLSVAGWGLWCFGGKKADAAPPALPVQQMPVTKPNVPIAEQKTPELPATPPIAEQQKMPDEVAETTIAPAKHKASGRPKPGKLAEPLTPIAPAAKLSEAEQRLQQLVAQKQREIGLDSLDRAAFADLLQELDELEISVQEARKDLGDMPQRERLMETLLKYYELKIRILEQINYEINKQKYHEELEKRI